MTLLELLDEYSVKIPIIQRDYAQGRRNAQTNVIRKTLLNDMKKALCKATPPLDLNFVYGKENNKEFIPIDGQQRLTTLFLLHLYAFRNDETKTSLFEKFTYETRASSREFFREIVKKRSGIFNTSSEYPRPSDVITDSSDFVSSYNYDPTVQSVLVMLDEIATIFSDVDNLCQALLQTENPPISFNFLNIDDLGLEDNLYIKLNARGKPLTDFENFKAKLLGRLKTLSESETLPFSVSDFEFRLDSEWTDIFWKRKGVKYEEEYRIFFEILLFNYGLIEPGDDNWVQTLDFEAIPVDVFISSYNLLNYLCSRSDADTTAMLIFNALKERPTRPTASDRVTFHFISVFLLKCSDQADSLAMHDWVRVFRNLVNNTLIDNYNSALDVIKAINDHSSRLENLTDTLSNIGKLRRCFDKDQLKEEIKKAAVILAERKANGSTAGNFETAICNAEKLPFFGGQIRAGLYLSEDKSAAFGYDFQKFRDYWIALEKLFGNFNDRSSLKYGILLRRALLSIGDYTLTVDENYKTLCSDHTDARGSISLKHLFSNCGAITAQLLNQIVEESDIKATLERIINANIKNIPQRDWRYCLIKYPELFTFMSSYYYRLRITDEDERVLLVNNARSSGTNVEAFTGALMYELEKRSIPTLFDVNLYKGNNIGKTTYGDYFIIYMGAHNKRYIIGYFAPSFVIYDSKDTELFKSKSLTPITETAEYIENMPK